MKKKKKKPADVMVGLPRDIRVGPHTVTITIMPPEWGLNVDGNVDVWGQYSDDQQDIRVGCAPPSKTQAIDTVVHEIAHAVYATYVIRPDDGEENTVRKMATGLTQVFRDSPALLKWISKNLAE